MYSTCPKCGYRLPEGAGAEACPACGIVFAKWLRRQLGTRPPPAASFTRTETTDGENEGGIAARLAAWMTAIPARLMQVEEHGNPAVFAAHVLLFLALLAYGWHFMRIDFVENPFAFNRSWMHNIDLVFHEAGHVFFRPLGWFMTILGGTLGQLIMPAVVLGTFLWQRRTFAATVGLWWLGQSFLDCVPYIDDALEQKLVLLGGHTGADAPGNHDWANILGEFDMLERHREFAGWAHAAGELLMGLALAWGATLLFRQWRRLA